MAIIDFTLNQWAFILMIFIIGWALGGLSRSGGGRKWRRAYEEEHALRLREEERVAGVDAHPVESVRPAR
jgi:hypothetical protein